MIRLIHNAMKKTFAFVLFLVLFSSGLLIFLTRFPRQEKSVLAQNCPDCEVEGECRNHIEKACSADDAKDDDISQLSDSIDDYWCTYNEHDGCQYVKSGVELINGQVNPLFWEGETCEHDESGNSSILWGEKKVYIDDISKYTIRAKVGVDDDSWVWINGQEASGLHKECCGWTNWLDVTSYLQTGWNTIKFKAEDTCSGDRFFNLDWNVSLKNTGVLTPELTAPKVFGQPDLGETVPNQVVGNRVFLPEGITIDRGVMPNRVFVWDSGNSRVLGFSSLGTCEGGRNGGGVCTNNLDCPFSVCRIDSHKRADLIIGQPDEFHASCNGDNTQYMPASASTLCSQPYPRAISLLESPEPSQMAVDSNHNLYVFDSWNNRVLKYNDPFADDTIADFVWGQDNFSDRECNKGNALSPTRNSLCGNSEVTNIFISGDHKGAGVDVDPSGFVWVADGPNNRVLRFPPNSKEADLVIGQKGFTDRDETACLPWEDGGVKNGVHPDIDYLCRPKAVKISPHTGQLFVIDWPHPVELFRVLIYNPPFSNGMEPSEILEGDRGDRYDYQFNRPTGIEIDPFVPGSFWLNDEDNSRALYFQKQDSTWTPTKVLSQPNLEKTGFGGFTCDGYEGTHYSCEVLPGGGIGTDSAGNIYLTDIKRHFVHIFSSPIPDADELKGKGYPADNTILISQLEGVSVPPTNFISEYGLSAPDSAILVDYPDGKKQLFVSDQYRIIFWNDYDISNPGNPASGVLFQDNFNSQRHFGKGIFMGLEKDSQGRLWVAKGDRVYVFKGPVTNHQSPDYEIPPTIPLRSGGKITSGGLVGLAYDEANDALWVSDNENHRLVRIHHPLDDSQRKVDMVLGQPNLGSTKPNRGVDDPDRWRENGWHYQFECPNIFPDGFANLGFLELDNDGNLYIVDASYEGWQCSNNRLLEYDREDLIPDPTKDFFEQGERVPKRVYGGSGFTKETKNTYLGPYNPYTPISVSFSKNNGMLMTVDAYNNPYLERVFWYDNPTPECDSPCHVVHSSTLPISAAQACGSSWDNNANLAILDHTWNRVLLFKACQDDDSICPEGCTLENDNDCRLEGDLNQNGQVDIQDLKILLENWGISPSIPKADLNADGLVNGVDFAIIRKLIQ